MSLRHVVGLLGRPWAITPEGFETVCAIIDRRAAGVRLTDEQIRNVIAELRAEFEAKHKGNSPGFYAAIPGSGSTGNVVRVAVISLYGTITPRPVMDVSGGGGAPLTNFMAIFQQADADPSVRAILLDVDSPGGSSDLVAEAAAMIRTASTPTTAIANTMAGSAASSLASQADEMVVSPSGMVGSIGVFARHVDQSGALAQEGYNVTLISAGDYKVDGNPYEPLSDTAREYLQSVVDEFYGMFVEDVAVGRGVSADEVLADFGQGRMLTASQALAVGMVDRVDTFEATVARLASAPSPRSTFARASVESLLDADDFAVIAMEETSQAQPAERPSGAEKPAPLDGRRARLVNGR